MNSLIEPPPPPCATEQILLNSPFLSTYAYRSLSNCSCCIFNAANQMHRLVCVCVCVRACDPTVELCTGNGEGLLSEVVVTCFKVLSTHFPQELAEN